MVYLLTSEEHKDYTRNRHNTIRLRPDIIVLVDWHGFCASVNMVLNVHRHHKAYQGREEGRKGVWRWGKREISIPVATLSPPE